MTPEKLAHRRPLPPNPDHDPALEKILAALRGLKFGAVEITVHDGCIVQIERREKRRLNIACPGGGPEDN